MTVVWEWIPSVGMSKEPVRVDGLPASEEEYGDSDYYDLRAPRRDRSFRAKGMTMAEYLAHEEALAERNQLVELTDNTGRPWVGRFKSITGDEIPGSDYVENILLTIEV